jgi:hypothetical protein
MGNYRDLYQFLNGKTNVHLLIMDTTNIQFLFKHQHMLPQSSFFAPYDLVIIPGWVHQEYAHHTGKATYVHSINKPLFFIDEIEDYLPMIGYVDRRLMELFKSASTGLSKAQQYFNQFSRYGNADLPDDWIESFYDQGFETKTTDANRQTKKNAGEVSIVALSYLLLSHFGTQISSIVLASSDTGTRRLNTKVYLDANKPNIDLGISATPPISLLSTDVIIFNALKKGIIQPEQIEELRQHTKDRTVLYVEHFTDGSHTFHEIPFDIPSFTDLCIHHAKYDVIF